MEREEALSFKIHSSSSSGSFHNDGVLSGESSSELYNRHVFLFDRLPRLLYAALLTNNTLINNETPLTICEGHDGTETSNGDVLIFPDMIRYRRLTHFDVETFVEEVLVKDGEWLPGAPERLQGSYVFVCSHGSRDRRCGVCGPVLVSRFKEEIELHSLQGKVFVSPCSHIGGHEYAGNVIIFGSSMNGEVTGHWYGYVAPDDVPLLIQQHILKGKIIDSLWRGQMGLSEYEQMKDQEQRLLLNGIRSSEESSAAYRSEDNFEFLPVKWSGLLPRKWRLFLLSEYHISGKEKEP